jgi:hypothetical protein
MLVCRHILHIYYRGYTMICYKAIKATVIFSILCTTACFALDRPFQESTTELNQRPWERAQEKMRKENAEQRNTEEYRKKREQLIEERRQEWEEDQAKEERYMKKAEHDLYVNRIPIRLEYAELLVPIRDKITANLATEREVMKSALEKIAQRIAHIAEQINMGNTSSELREEMKMLLNERLSTQENLQVKDRKFNNISGYIQSLQQSILLNVPTWRRKPPTWTELEEASKAYHDSVAAYKHKVDSWTPGKDISNWTTEDTFDDMIMHDLEEVDAHLGKSIDFWGKWYLADILNIPRVFNTQLYSVPEPTLAQKVTTWFTTTWSNLWFGGNKPAPTLGSTPPIVLPQEPPRKTTYKDLPRLLWQNSFKNARTNFARKTQEWNAKHQMQPKQEKAFQKGTYYNLPRPGGFVEPH